MKELIKKWLGIHNHPYITLTLEDWISYKEMGIGIGLNGELYPPTFENWMKHLQELKDKQ